MELLKLPGTLPLVILCFLVPGSSTADDAVTVEAPSIKWQMCRENGSGFIDALWFDDNEDGKFEGDEQIVSGSGGCPRLVVRLAVPAAGIDLPVGARVNWRQFPATLKIIGVRRLAGDESGTEVSGELLFPDGAAQGKFTVTLRASKEKGVLLAGLELSWSKLPAGSRLVEAGFELETDFEPEQIINHMHPDAPATWSRHHAGGYGVAPVVVGTYVPQPTGGTGVRYLTWLQENESSGSRVLWGSDQGKSYRMSSEDTVEWCDFSEERRGVAVILKGVRAAPPKMFGTLGRNEKSLYAWAWPPTVDGLPVRKDAGYSCTNIAWYLHRGRARWLQRAKNKTYFFGLDENRGPGAMQAINDLRRKLPAVSGNLVAPDEKGLARLPEPAVGWMKGLEEGENITLPPADPKPAKNRIPILVAGGEAGATRAAPFRCGVAFPKQKLNDVKQLRLVGEKGSEIPCQVEKTAVWPDGSIKWALIDFVAAGPAGRSRVAAYLEWGEGVSRGAAPATPVKVGEEDGMVTVDTGVLCFTAVRGNCGFLRTVDLDLDGDGKYSATERVIDPPAKDERRNRFTYVHQENLAAYLSRSLDVSGKVDPADVVVESVTIEAAGPVRVTLCIKGKYRHRFFQPLAVDHLSGGGIYNLVPRRHQGDTWTPPAAEEGSEFTVWLSAWADSSSIRVVHDFVLEGISGFQHATSIGLSAQLNLDSDSRRVMFEGADPTEPLTAKLKAGEHLSNIQYERGRARVIKISDDSIESLAAGPCASDWVDVSDQRWGLTVGMKDMWALNPQAIQVSADGVSAWFWPPHVAPWDSRGPGGHSAAFTGISRTHEAVFHFHKAGTDPEQLRAVARRFTRPAYAHASTWWTCSTGALGLCHPYDPEGFPQAERRMRGHFLGSRQAMMLSRSQGQPGMVNYGSCDSTEAYTQYALALQAARTGHPGQYRAALAKCRFDAGIAFRKGTTRERTGLTGFTANHPTDWATSFYRSCGDAGSRGAQIMYYLTGDEPLREFADWKASRMLTATSLRLDPRRDRIFDHYGRAALGHLLWAWERGGKGEYAGAVNAAFTEAAAAIKRGEPPGTKLYNGTSNAIVELYVHSGEPTILEVAKTFADDAIAAKGQKRWTARVTMPAFVFWSTGDEKYLDIMQTHLSQPPVGGAFWHWTMYEMMHMQANMAALARHKQSFDP